MKPMGIVIAVRPESDLIFVFANRALKSFVITGPKLVRAVRSNPSVPPTRGFTASSERKEAEARVAQVTRELVERNEKLWRLQKETGQMKPLATLGRVTGMIAHELGTPLNTMLGHCQFLGEEKLTKGGRRG